MSDRSLIVLIDAHQEDREHYSRLLQISSPRFVVLHAATGRSGLALCQQQPVDCVVLEIDLPDMSGFEVLFKLVPLPQHAEIAVVILTRFANHYLLEAAIRNGAQAALYKSTASAENLDRAIHNAISIVQAAQNRLAV